MSFEKHFTQIIFRPLTIQNMMIKKTIAIVLLIAFQWSISAQNYNVLLIPDSLKTNADLVSIFDHTTVEIVNQRSMIITTKNGSYDFE
jgi:hypothetical protein